MRNLGRTRLGDVDVAHWQPVGMSRLLFLVRSLEARHDVVHLERADRRAAQTVSVDATTPATNVTIHLVT